MSAQYDSDPPRKWRRKAYDEGPLRSLDYRKSDDRRKGSEIETDRDLGKPVEQLVCDVHEETHDPNRTDLANIAGAQKRMVSMMACVAKSNDRMTRWMLILTVVIAAMTAIILYLTVVMTKQSNSSNKPVETTSLAHPEIRERCQFAAAPRSVSHG